MHVLEVIDVRLYDPKDYLKIESLLCEVRESETVIQVRLYRNLSVDSDVSVHLQWPSRIKGNGKSPLAHLLTDFLSSIGIVNHLALISEFD